MVSKCKGVGLCLAYERTHDINDKMSALQMLFSKIPGTDCFVRDVQKLCVSVYHLRLTV